MFVYKQCPSLFGLRENHLIKTRNCGVLERSWTGSVLVQCRDQKIIPDTGKLVFSERSMVNCFAQKLNGGLCKGRLLKIPYVFRVYLLNALVNFPGRGLMDRSSVNSSPVIWQTFVKPDYIFLVIGTEQVLTIEKVLLNEGDE